MTGEKCEKERFTDFDRCLLVLELGQLDSTGLDTEATGDQRSELGVGRASKDFCFPHYCQQKEKGQWILVLNGRSLFHT